MSTTTPSAGGEPPSSPGDDAGTNETRASGSTEIVSSEPTAAPPPQPPDRGRSPDPLRGSRTSGLWAGVIGLGLVLILLIIFIAQNTQNVTVSFLGWTGETPLAVALLAAAVGALLLTASAGTLRIWQLRRRVRKEVKRESRA